jgi:hypothetical protein
VILLQHSVIAASDACLVRLRLRLNIASKTKENSLEDRNTAPRDKAEVLAHRSYIPD